MADTGLMDYLSQVIFLNSTGMTFNFVCHLGWCPDIVSNIILDISVFFG